MKTQFKSALTAVAATLLTFAVAAPLSASNVTIEWVDRESYRDLSETHMPSDRDRDYILRELESSFVEEASRYLPDGATLHLSFTRVQLAGQFEPWRGPRYQDVRIVRDMYPARLHFTWRLLDAGNALIEQGEEQLSSMGMVRTVGAFDRQRHPYVHELFRRWARQNLR